MDKSIETSTKADNNSAATFTPHRHSLPAKQNIASKSQPFSNRAKTHNRRISDYSIHTQPPPAFANQRSALSPQQIRQTRLRILPTQFESGGTSQDSTLPDTSLKGFRKFEHDNTTEIPKQHHHSLHHVTV